MKNEVERLIKEYYTKNYLHPNLLLIGQEEYDALENKPEIETIIVKEKNYIRPLYMYIKK